MISGGLSTRRFKLIGDRRYSSDEFWIESLNKGAFEDTEIELGEENYGFAVYDNELSSTFDITNCVYGRFVLFSYRKDSIQIPTGTMKMHLAARIEERKKTLQSNVLSVKQRNEIKAEVTEYLSKRQPITTNNYNVLIDTVNNYMYIGNTSDKICDGIVLLVGHCFGFDVQQCDSCYLGDKFLQKDEFDMFLTETKYRLTREELPFNPQFEDSPAGEIGSGFLTWLLINCITDGENFMGSSDTNYFVDEVIELQGATEGSRTTSLSKGSPTSSDELIKALQAGKMVSKLRIWMAEPSNDGEEEVFVATIDKEYLDCKSAKLPKVKETDRGAYIITRFEMLMKLYDLLDELFQKYAEIRMSDDWEFELGRLKEFAFGK